MATDTSLDPAAEVLAQVKYDHHQHVCSKHPEPGICVSRCHGRPWPCAPYRAAQAVEAVLRLHRRSLGPATIGEHQGRHYCPACTTTGDHFTDYEDWPCFEYLAILAALTGTTVVAITARELAEHKASCIDCIAAGGRQLDGARCPRGVELEARLRRAIREAGP